MRATLRSLVALVVCLAASSCGEEEWDCEGFASPGVDELNNPTCNAAWSCEGDEFESVQLSVECTAENAQMTCECVEHDFSTGRVIRGPDEFSGNADDDSPIFCTLSAEAAQRANDECGWSVPEEDP